MNAIDFLINEHNRVRQMMSEISNNSYHFATKIQMFHTLSEDLIRHEHMEHEVWYPHFKDKLSATVKHLVKEELHAEKAILQFNHIQSEEEFASKFDKFKTAVEHHAQEEEQTLFPEVQTLLNENELEQIGQEMFQFKKKHTKH